MIALLVAVALAVEPPPPRPPGEVVVVDEATLAMPAPLALWYEKRHRYAGQLEAEVKHLDMRLDLAKDRDEVDALRLQACEVALADEKKASNLKDLRTLAAVGVGMATILAAGWTLGQLN